MMKVMPYDPSHEEVYNAFIMKTEPKTEVFSAKPTETDRQEAFWNRNNTIHYSVWKFSDSTSILYSLQYLYWNRLSTIKLFWK